MDKKKALKTGKYILAKYSDRMPIERMLVEIMKALLNKGGSVKVHGDE